MTQETQKKNTFGQYQLNGWRASLLDLSQSTPANWFGRRASLILRKIILKSSNHNTIDATVDGIKLRCHVRDNISERKFLFMPQFCDPVERDLINRYLPQDGVFLDIGANAGIYSLTAAKRLNDTGRVLSIEPNPEVLKRLEHNLKINKFSQRAIIEPIGISDSEGSFSLLLDDSNLGGSSLVTKRSETGGEINVRCYPLLTVLQKNKISHVDFMKIDIEGAEEQALMPFFNTAPTKLFPHYIIIENSIDSWESDLIGFIKAKGYRVFQTTRMNLILKRL